MGRGRAGNVEPTGAKGRTNGKSIRRGLKFEPVCLDDFERVLLPGRPRTMPFASVNCVPSWNNWYHANVSDASLDVQYGSPETPVSKAVFNGEFDVVMYVYSASSSSFDGTDHVRAVEVGSAGVLDALSAPTRSRQNTDFITSTSVFTAP